MAELVVVGIVAGFLAGISPCILPVLPIVLVAGTSTPAGDEAPARVPRAGLARSLAVVGGLILSFSIIVLAGSLSGRCLADDFSMARLRSLGHRLSHPPW